MATDFGRDKLTTSFFPEDNLVRRPLQMGLTQEDQQRFARYSRLWDFYNGRHWQDTPERKDGDSNITLNFCRLFVNKGASFLTGKGWTIKDREMPYSRSQLEFLSQVWRVSNKDIFTFEMAQMGGTFGDVYVTVFPDNNGGISIKLIPPMFVTPFWHPADRDVLLGARIQFPLNDTDGYRSGNQTKRRMLTILLDAVNISQYIDNTLISSQPHGIGEVPLVVVRNRPESGAANGTSDIATIIPVNKLINEKVTDVNDIIAYHAAPVTIAYGVKIKQLQRGARKVWSAPSYKEAKIENLTMDTDLAAANAHIKSLMDYMFMLAEMPVAAFGMDQAISNTTGVALQVLFQPLMDATQVKQKSYGAAIASINRLIIKYGIAYGYLERFKFSNWFDLQEYYQTDIDWANPLPMDQLLNLNMIINRLNSGLITVADALSQLGVANVKQYIEQLMADRESGVNIAMVKALAALAPKIDVNSGKQANLGGIARNGSTVQQMSDLALGDGPDNQLSQKVA